MGERGPHSKFVTPKGQRVEAETYHIRLTKTMRRRLSNVAYDLSKAQDKYISEAELIRSWLKEKLDEHEAKQATISKAPSYGK